MFFFKKGAGDPAGDASGPLAADVNHATSRGNQPILHFKPDESAVPRLLPFGD